MSLLGPELITTAADREFSSDTGWWVKYGTGTTIAGGTLNCFTDGVQAGVYRDAVLTYGAKYRVRFTIGNYSGGSEVGLAPGPVSGGYYLPAAGTYDVEFVHDGSVSGRLGIWCKTPGVTFDDISLREITGDDAGVTYPRHFRIGPELLPDADRRFDSDSGYWTKIGSAFITGGVGTQTADGASSLYHGNVLDYGATYRCEMEIANHPGGDWVGLALCTVNGYYHLQSSGFHAFEFVHDGTVPGRFRTRSIYDGVTFDNISVREYIGDSATEYTTDFSEYTTGVQPADVTKRWHALIDYTAEAGGPIGGKILKQSNSTGENLNFLSYDPPGEFTDGEILALHRLNYDDSGIDYGMGLCLRGSGDSVSETGYLVNWDLGAQVFRVMRYNAASGVTINTHAFAFAYNQWVWTRFRVASSAVKVRAWLYGNTEPGGWTAELTDTVLSGPGRAGIFSYDGVADEYAWFSVAVGSGGTAPGPELNSWGHMASGLSPAKICGVPVSSGLRICGI
jgi:hypothetical protein